MTLARLGREFFARDARVVARALVGCRLVDARGPAVRVGRVVETEAYRGPSDGACHARFGLTARTRALFGAPGTAYVFFVYGMHHCFNVVCLDEGRAHAVLLRAIEPEQGFDDPPPRTDGPGRLASAFSIDRSLDGGDLVDGALHFAAPSERPIVVVSPRVGVGYAGAHAEWPLRFFDARSSYVSRPSRRHIGLGAERSARSAPDQRALRRAR